MPDYKEKLANLERLVMGNHINKLCEEATTLVRSLSEADKSTIFKDLYTDTGEFSDGENLDIVFRSHKYSKREKVTLVVVLLINHGLPLDTKLDNNKTLLEAIILLKKDNVYRRKFIEAILESPRLDDDIKKILGFVPCIRTAGDLERIASHFVPPNGNSSLFCLSGVCNLFSGIMPGTGSGYVADSKRQDPKAEEQAQALLVKKNQ